MRAPLPPRRWRRVVAAAQGIVLTVAAAGILPAALVQVLLAAALAALAASMGECAWWLWRRRAEAARARAAARRTSPSALTVLAAGCWSGSSLVTPDQPGRFTLGAFVRLPLELLVVVALAVAAARRRRGACWSPPAGVALSALVLVKLLDVGFFIGVRPALRPGRRLGLSRRRHRHAAHRGRPRGARTSRSPASACVVVALLAIPVAGAAARDPGRRRPPRLGAARGGGAGRAVGGAARSPARRSPRRAPPPLARHEVRAVRAGPGGPREVRARRSPTTASPRRPGNRLLTGLRGKDVLVVFVESYGQSAVQGSSFAPGVDALLQQGTAQLQAARASPRAARSSPRRRSAA